MEICSKECTICDGLEAQSRAMVQGSQAKTLSFDAPLNRSPSTITKVSTLYVPSVLACHWALPLRFRPSIVFILDKRP